MRAMSTAASAVRHTFGVALEALILLAIVAALAFGVALASGHPLGASSVFAAKGGNSGAHGGGGGGGSGGGTAVTITVPDGVFGGTTTASVSGASGLWVRAACSATSGGSMVTWVATDPNGQATIQLGPTPTWTSGGASCTAQAGHFSSSGQWVADASTTFNVSA